MEENKTTTNESRKWLYERLTSNKVNLGSFEQFEENLNNEQTREWVYGKASQIGLNLGSYDDFTTNIITIPTESTASESETEQEEQSAQVADPIQPANPVSQVKDESTESPDTYFHTDAMEKRSSMIDNAVKQTESSINSQLEETKKDIEDLSLGTFNHTKDNGLQFNPSTGKLESTYTTPYGTTTTDRRLANMESYQYRAASDMTVSGQIRQANIKLEQLKNKAEQRRQQIIQGWRDKYQEEYKKAKDEGKALIWHLGNTLGQDQHSYITRTNEELLTDQEYRAYQAAIRQTEEQISTLEREGDRQSGKRVGFWRGFGEITGDLRTWDFGMQDILDAKTMAHAGKESSSESVNQANQELLEATFKNQQAQQSYGQNDNFWYRAGTMTGHMPAFMVDFAITGGGFEGINVLAKTATKGATKVIGKEVIEGMAKQGFKSYVKANGVKGFGQYAGNWTIKALGTMADDLIIRAPLMTNTVQGAKTTADIIDRKLGSVIVNEDGTYDFSNDKTWSSAIWQGEANSIIENYSEMFGAHLAPVTFKNMSDVAAVFGAKRLSGVLAKADAGAIGAIMGKTNEMFTKLGVSDYFGEVTEEYYGQLWRTMLNLDDAYRQNPDGTRTNLLLTGQFHGDILGGMALSMGMMGAGKYSLTAANYAFMKHDVNKADSRARELFGNDTWEPLRQTIDLTTNDDIGGYIDNVIADTELTDTEKATILNYIERSLYLRGFNLATLAQSRNSEETDEGFIEQQNNESYMDGYNATGSQEMNDVNNNYLYQREMMAQMFGIDESDIESFLGEDPIATAVRMRQNGASNEEVQTVIDYLNAKATYDGMLQGVRDDIDGQIEQSNALIDSYINKGTGMVHGAVLKEGEHLVYIVNGNAVAFDDGVIDNHNSSQTIIVKDAATGELRQISPTDIASLYDVQDPNEQKEMNAQRIRDGVADEALNKINGVVDFSANMVNQIGNTIGITMVLTERGFDKEYIKTFLANAQIVENPDGTLTFTDGQNNVVVPKQEIQQKTDAANMERVAAINEGIKEERAALEGLQEGTEDTTETTATPSSLIPKDESGNPIYEQADPATAWDALMEEAEGDEEIAMSVAQSMIADREKELSRLEKTKVKEGSTVAEKTAAHKAHKAAIEQARQNVDAWRSIASIPAMRQQAEAEERKRIEDEKAAQQEAELERILSEQKEAARLENERLNGIPDYTEDTPQNARTRGYRRVNGHFEQRQQPLQTVQGKETEVEFSNEVRPKGRYAVIDASQLQPSHIQGNRNPMHFLDEAQPKERNDNASIMSAQKIAGNIRPATITTGETAYVGTPTVNARGEVIQGNSRSDALKLMYGNHKDQGQIYKQYLIDNAEQFGLNPEDVANMENPVLVRMLDVSDEQAITLGQYVAQDTESGGVERIKPKNAVKKMGSDMRTFANILLDSADEDLSFAELLDSNGVKVLKWMNQKGYITDTQYSSAFDSRGNLTGDIKNDLRGIMFQSIFEGGNTRLEEMFNALPAKAQKAILATAHRDFSSPNSERMIEEIQNSIRAFYALMQDEQFAKAKDYKSACKAAEAWQKQYQMDDITGESYLPSEKFSNFALHLAKMYKGNTQSFIQNMFSQMYDFIQGTQQDNLFEQADNTPRTLVQAIKKVLNIDYNGRIRSNVLGDSAQNVSERRSGSDRDAGSRERTESEKQPADDSGRTEGMGRRSGIDGENRGNQSPKDEEPNITGGRSLSTIEAQELIAEMEQTAEVAPEIELTIENWDSLFGEDGIVSTPIGEVKMGENQFTKLMRQGRDGKLGMIKPTLENPDVIIEDNSNIEDEAERQSSYIFVRTFKKADGSRYYYFTSITVSKDGKEVVVSNQEKKKNRIQKLLEKGSVIWRTPKDAATSSAERQGLDYEQSHEAETATKGSGITPQSTSVDKDTTISQNNNKLEEKVSENNENNSDNSISEQIQAAEKEVNTSPTDKQKEAGNYKKGHVQIGTFNITIEQPKGSVRSGVDANGRKWETTMHNTYGYIRGTEGVDGDHIDVFLSDDIDGWNGSKVFVVDQYNEDGTFDEHKVMLGFNTIEEAESAYLANYEKGWEKKHKIVVSPIHTEEFEKWIDSSHRKTKAFAEYKSVQFAEKEDRFSPIQGYSYEEIIETVSDEIKDILNDSGIEGVDVKEVWAHGSRMRGDAKDDSDLDIVMFYEGDAREDDLFNTISESGLAIEGVRIDVNPIRIKSQKDIDRYKEKSRQYDKEKMSKNAEENSAKDESNKQKTIVEQSKKPSSKIEDFGEKIGGARKDVIRKYADKINVNGTTFSAMFPRPEIDKLIEAGLPIGKVAAVKTMFDNAKREFDLKKKHYGKDKALQSAAFFAMYAQNVLTGNESNFDLSFKGFAFTEWGKAFMKANIALYQSVFDRLGVEYGKMDLSSYGINPITEENKKKYNLKHLNEQNRKSQEEFAKRKGTEPPVYKDGDLINFVGGQYYNPKDQFETLEEAVDTMVERIEKEVKVGEESKHKAEIYWKLDALGRTDYSKIFVGVKVHGHGKVDLMEFKSSKEANDWIREHDADFQQMAAAKTEQLKSDKSKPLPKYRIDHRFVRNDNGSIVRYEVFADFGKGITHTLKTFEIPAKESSQDRLRAQGEVYKNEVLPYMNSDDAKQSADEHARRIQREKESKNKNYTTERKSRERVGKDWRNGKDATPDMFVDMDGKKSVFGFRAVEFGNYVANKERQQFLNDIYDALMDMSDVLGVSPRALSLGGQLAIAVGARGKSSASGHYEPEKNVINLTKTSGYGVLAHEWLHAFDRYFSNYDPSAIYVGGVRYATGTEYKDDTRQEVKDAFAALMDVMKKSDYYKRSMTLGEYWASDKELAARALQDHIIRKLNERGQKNDFLSNLTATEDWDGNANDYPFPIGEESERIGEAIDSLFSVIEEKVDEKGNAVMYQKGELVMNAESEAFRRATERTMKQLESIGIDVEIVEDVTIIDNTAEKQVIENYNEKFNRELQQQINGTLPKGHIYQLGMAGAKLQSAGIPYLPIELAASRLSDKSMQENHPFELSEIEGLVESVQNPLAVFRSATRIGSFVVLTEIQHEGKNYVAAIQVNRKMGKVEVNTIRSIYPKDGAQIANWIEEGLSEYVDKEKMSEWISKQRSNSADVRNLFRRAANIIQKFENRAIRPNFSRSAGVFYSNAKKAVLDIRQDKATAQQWIAMLKKNGGLKSGEDAWVGLEEWLNKQEGSVTKQEIIDYIDENSIQIEEVYYSQFGEGLIDEATRKLDAELKEIGWNAMLEKYPRFDELFELFDGELVWSENRASIGEYEDFIIDNKITDVNPSDNAINETRAGYTTAGLKGNREIVITVPGIEPYNRHDGIHFGDAGDGRAVVWIRFGETTDKDGKRVLVIDEIQSKRHQDGREKGYQEKGESDKIRKRIDALFDEKVELSKEILHRMGYIHYSEEGGKFDPDIQEKVELGKLGSKEEMEKMKQIDNDLNDAFAAQRKLGESIPSAPFEKNWQELAMKRMLRYAAENGFDKVAWTTGEQQAERYNLSKTVKKTTVSVNPNNTRMVTLDFRHDEGYMDFVQMRVDENGTIIGGDFIGSQLSDVVGKEFAIKIMGVEAEREIFTDNDLKIGGEGMKGFYDKILPSFVSKYTKKWGGQVEETELPETGLNMHSVDVTPQMKEDVMKGQPMFMRTSSGTIYGWTVNGKIYLTKDGINPNTPVHEYAHLWAESMANSNPKRWKRIIEGLKDSPVWNEVLLDSEYKDIHGNDNLIASEVLSRLSGNENYKRTMEEAQREIESEKDIFAKAEKVTIWERVKQALKDFWNWVGLRFTRRPISPEQSADMVLADFWNGIRPEAENGPMQRMFVGEKGAANIDKAKEATSRLDNLSVARNMETEGKDAKNIKLATGWERGSDGKWRYEVMDDFRFDRSGNVDFEKRNPEYRRYKELVRKNNALAFEGKKLSAEEKSELDRLSAVWKGEKLHNSRRLKDYIDAPELFEAYPELKGVDVRFEVLEDGVQGKYNHKQNTITLNAMLGKEDAVSTLNHEIQHAIQHIEGFAKGGNSNDVITRKQEFKSEVRKLHEMMLETPEWAEYVRLVDRWIDNEDASVEARIDKISASGVLDGIRSEQGRLRRKYGSNAIVSRILNGPYAEDADIWNELPDSFNDRFDAYRRLAGEVESRNVQRRMEMSAEERRSSLAQETEDVGREDQVFLYDALENAEKDDVLYREDENETAPETAVQHDAGHSTVVSSADGAKILKDLDNTISEYKNKTSNRQKTFIGDLSRALNLRNNGNNSNYGTFIAINGKILELRISDHNVSTKNMADAGKTDGISIVITHKPNKGINNDDSRAHIVEFYYNTQKLQKESGQPYVKILESVKQSLYSGEYKDNTGIAVREEVNEDAIYNNNEWYRTSQNQFSPTRSSLEEMTERVNELTERLNLDNVEVIIDASHLEGKKKSAKGFYDPKTGKITIVIPNNTSVADVERTLLHEAVAHHGLRQLFGKNFDTFLDNVFNNVEEEIRRKIVNLAAKNGWDFRKATEEYLATLAENTSFENAQQSGWWQKVKDFFVEMLGKLGFKGTLTDNELRYVLWRSYENLKEKKNDNIFSLASDIAKQHELGVGDYAKASQSEDDVLFRDGDDYKKALAREQYEARLRTGWYQTQEALQDSMLGLKEAMSAILEDDVNIKDIDGFENAYLGENRLSSVNKAEADAFAHILFKPMLDEVAKLSHNSEERETLTDYMMAKHGLERNEYMRQQAIQNGEDANRDFAGLTSLTGFDDITAAEAEAKRMVDEYEQDHDTTELWDKVNAVSNAILQKLHDSGLMSKETFDNVSSMYQYYIPLRGFEEKTSEEAYAYLTHSHSVFNVPIKKAQGRKSKADDPFANLQSMAESAIMQGNRNRLVKQRFLNFVINHPSDLVSVSELWIEHDDVTDEWKPVFPDNLNDNDTPEEIEQKFKDFEDKMQSLTQQYPDKYKHGRDAIGIPYRIVNSRDLNQHQVIVKRGGRDIILTVNGNPRLAQALNGQTNPDNDMSGAIGAILRSGEWVNRQLSAFYTTRNPDFIVSNFVRDMFYTNTMTWIKESPNYALRFHKNYVMANPVTMKRLLNKYRKGTLDLGDKTEYMFYQFMMNGGETGYVNIRDIEQHKNDIRKELNKANGRIKIGRALSLLAERFDELNRSVENCARFAAFVTSREMGRTLDRSIYDAKEISVNFNKKGSGAKFYGSVGQTFSGNASALVSGLGRSGYVFWNAAIQGTTNFGRQVKRHPAKAFTGIAAMFLLGALVAYLGGDDDDDKNAYYNLPEYVRRSNILFRAGDSWVSIPLPIEYRAIYGMGELMTSVLSGKEHLTDGEVAESIAGQVSQMLPIDFLEGGGGLNAFVPSAAKPLWEAYVAEKSWTGMPIYKDTPYNKNMPEWTKAYKSTNKHIVNLAATLNEATGGDRYTKGSVDINPAKIEYMLNGYFSGVWGTINKLSKTAETIAGEREYDPSNILLMNRLVKAGDERTEYRAVNNEYFRLKEEHDQLKTRLRKYENDTYNGVFDYAEKIDFLYNSPEYQRYEIFELYNKEINDLNDILKETYNNEERKYLESELNELKKEMIQEIDKTRQTRKGA